MEFLLYRQLSLPEGRPPLATTPSSSPSRCHRGADRSSRARGTTCSASFGRSRRMGAPSPSPSRRRRRERPLHVSLARTVAVGCLAAHACTTLNGGSAVVAAAGLRPATTNNNNNNNHHTPPEESAFPLVVRTRHGSVAEADDVLSPLNLDLMGRGRHLDPPDETRSTAAHGPTYAYSYERDVLLHSSEEWAALLDAVGGGRDDGDDDGIGSWEIDVEHTELLHFRTAGDADDGKYIRDEEEGQAEGSREERRLNQYETMAYFPCYRTVQGTYHTMYELQEQYPDLVSIETIGASFQGESILMLQITGPESTTSPIAAREPAVFTSGLHAREYAPPEIATRFAEHLVASYGTDADITAVLDHTVLHFVLQSNPDSRRIAERNYANAQPRKNQRDDDGCSSSDQWGTDLNRNFDFQHGNPGASSSPCHIIYHGRSGGSEGETKAIQDLSRRVFPEWQRKADPEAEAFEAVPDTARGLYVDIHSYGRDIIFPYGYQDREVGNIDAFKSMSHKICSINKYNPSGGAYYFLGRTSGDTLDYHYGALGVASILYEVGNSWAESCSVFESSVYPPNLEALLYTTKLAMTPYRTSLGPDVLSIDVAVSDGGDRVTINADVSDYAMTELSGKKQLSTAVQSIQSVKAYLDSHPYDASPSQPMSMTPSGGGSFSFHTESVSLSFDTSSIDGRHTICLVASDTDGYDGTVSCEYIEIPVKADATLTPQDQGGAIADEEPTTSDINSTNLAELPSTETTDNITPLLTTETIPSDIVARDNDGCSDISSEVACNDADVCRWRSKKDKCVGICQGRQTEEQCVKHAMCQWDANVPKCFRK